MTTLPVPGDWRLESIVKQYSNYVKWPIKIGERQLNRATALWAKRPSEVSEDEYKDFYKELMGGFVDGEPLARLHIHLDAPYQFQAIVYIPRSRASTSCSIAMTSGGGMQLYVRRVFILDHADELLPPWLRFVRGSSRFRTICRSTYRADPAEEPGHQHHPKAARKEDPRSSSAPEREA